ncbi:hypothetical protein ADK70_04765 [Streptomyces rimosus subsp. pseudoverticillatus]|uniref:hypothetical protein n=1 Tax=Streptomyces rimosus TaxID=1927 RepID=UPI0006B28304|nr:hypothetical protein [Streptomyces rimosus]KOT99153.1 hypothetical protein ADK70_04765 [Streptomyces rimosus subsp. pseudoverticillatus]
MSIGKKLASTITTGVIVTGGIVLGTAPARAATCDHKLHEITVPGGYSSYWCWAGEAQGTVQDTRPDGKCAYLDVWGDRIALRTYSACGFGKVTNWHVDGGGGAVHIRLRTA